MSDAKENQFKKMEIPTFESEIPDFLLKQSSPVEKHLLQVTSRIAHNMEWQNQGIVGLDLRLQETNGKVRVMHALYRALTAKPSLVLLGLVVLLGYPAYLSLGLDRIQAIALRIASIFM